MPLRWKLNNLNESYVTMDDRWRYKVVEVSIVTSIILDKNAKPSPASFCSNVEPETQEKISLVRSIASKSRIKVKISRMPHRISISLLLSKSRVSRFYIIMKH